MPIFFHFDFTSKQKYIFATNTLKEVVGASSIMDKINEKFKEVFKDETLYSGGGNGVAIFDSQKRVEEAVKFLNDNCLKVGISFIYASHEYEKKDNAAYQDIKKRLAGIKMRGQAPDLDFFMPHGRLCRSCMSRNVSAGGDPDICYVCSAKNAAGLEAHRDIVEAMNLHKKGGPGKWFLMDLSEIEKFNREDKLYSLIAVVKMDGNALGKKLTSFIDKSPDNFMQTGELSQKIDDASHNAIAQTCLEVFDGYIKAEKRMPFRPLIVGGDDIAFAISSKYAFEFTRKLSEYFTENTKGIGFDSPVTISAGIVFTHSSFPIVQSVELAESLLSNAKKHGLKLNAANPPAMIDFQVMYGSLNDSIEETRSRECTIIVEKETEKEKIELWQKPYLLYEAGYEVKTIDSLEKQAKLLGDVIERSKIKKLREIFKYDENSRSMMLRQIKSNIKNSKDIDGRKTFDECMNWAKENSKAYNCNSSTRREGALDLVEVFDLI